MIECCYKCTKRWVKDGRTCHSTCPEYADAVEADRQQRRLRFEAQAGEREVKAYKRQHYKAVDRRDQRAELLRRKKY